MKLKKLLAAVTAAALAVTTMAVTSFTASAAAFTPYILLNVNSNDWGINGAWVAADKTEITASQTEYEFSYTAGKDDTWDGDQSKIEAYFYSPMDNLKNASIKSVSINGTDKNISQSAGSYNQYLWDNIENGTVPGYSAVVNPDAVKALGAVTNGDVIKIVLSVTLDESLKSIGAANFTCSKTAGELETGDSFTITYDSTNTPDTAKWVVKCAFDEDFADAGITNRWPQLVNSDGTVDNSASADTGLEVEKTVDGVYTFTAVNASKAGYVINVEASAAGDFSDTQYLGQGGGGKWSVAAAAKPAITISPTTLTVAEGEDAVITITATNADDYIYEAESSDDAKATATVNGTTVTVKGKAAGTAEITVTGKKTGADDITAKCTVTVTEGTTPPAAETIEIAFPTDVIKLTVMENKYDEQDPHGLMAKADIKASGESIGKTFAELKTDKLKLTGVKFDNCSIDGITAGDVKATLFTQWTGWTWNPAAEAALNSESIEFDLSTITGVKDTDELLAYGVQIAINDNSKLTGMKVGDTVKINEDSVTPPTPSDGIYALLWEGTKNMPADWSGNVEIDMTKDDIISKVKAGDKIVATFTSTDGAQIALKYKTDGWPALPGFAAANGGHDYSDVITGTAYTHTVTAEDIEALRLGLIVSGHDYTLTKVELNPDKKPGGEDPKPPVVDPDHTHTPATVWSSDATGHWHACSGCNEKLDFAAHTSDGGKVTTPATETTTGTKTYKCTECGYVIRTESIPATGSPDEPQYPSHSTGNDSVVIPIGGINNSRVPSVNGKNGWEAVSDEITAASDGDKIIVDMNSATKVPSTLLGDLEGKDVDVVFNMGRGITWTVNGLSVTSRKTIDLDITKNTKHIPDEIVDKAEGSHKKQISLDHKGIFGCTAALTYDVGAKYNGLYANLFYYNPKTEQLEFADCSLISGGKAKFVFTHASDYLITISDEPLGEFEDVSSAAGIASDNSIIGNGAVLGSVLAVIVLGFGIVVYRKRRHN